MNQTRILLKTLDCAIVQNDNGYELKKSGAFGLLLGLVLLVVAAIFWGVGYGLANVEGESHAVGLLLKGLASLLSVVAAICLLVGISVRWVPKWKRGWIIDRTNKILNVGKETILLKDITAFQTAPFAQGFISLVAVRSAGNPKLMLTVSSKYEPILLDAMSKFNLLLGPSNEEPKAITTPVSEPFGFNFPAVLMMSLGILWTMGGYFFFPNLYFTGTLDPGVSKTPVWTIGLVPIAYSLYFFLKGRKDLGND